MAVKAGEMLLPIFRESKGKKGRISIQTNAKFYRSWELMAGQALHFHTLAPNIQVKMPVTSAGVKAIEESTAQGVSVNATVSFSVPQALAVADAVQRGLDRRREAGEDVSEMSPVCTIMVGRLDDWLKITAEKSGVSIDPGYLEWAADYHEDQVTIVYDTMWKATRRMAEHIAQGIRQERPSTTVKIYNAAISDKNDVITEVFKSKGVIVGSPTINRGILTSIAGLMEEIKGLKLQGKVGAAFGSYGWSGESMAQIEELLKQSGFSILIEGTKVLWQPDEKGLNTCIEFGKSYAKAL